MFRTKLVLTAAACALALSASPSAPAFAAPLETYGRLPQIEEAVISPDGAMVAYATTDGENRFIAVRNISDGKIVGGMRANDVKIRDLSWAGSGHLLITTSKTALVHDLTGPRQEYFMAQTLDLETGKQRLLMERAEGSMNVIYGTPHVRMVDGEVAVIVEGVNFVDNKGRLGLFRVKLKNSATRLLDDGFENTNDWVVGDDGKGVAQTEYDQKTGEWRLRIRTGGRWEIAERLTASVERPWLAGLGRTDDTILVSFPSEDGGILKEYPLAGGAPTKVMDQSYDSIIRDPATRRLIGYTKLVGDEQRYIFFDPKAEAAWKAVVKAFAGDRVRLASWSDDRRKIIVVVDSAKVGQAYAMVDLDKKSAVWLGEVYDGLSPEDVAEVRPVTYKAADGLEIHGYLTLPRDKPAKDLPLVVLPHGGPEGRDTPGFDWWSQALASRGYAVLQPNFRGSEGYGLAFIEAGYGQWGRKMQTDLSDGVRHLAGQGLIDPKRVCIVGASYGGYAALAGPTLDRGVYRCAVAVSGVSDLRRMLDAEVSSVGTSEHSTLRYWQRFMGVDGRRDPDLAAISPARLAAQADAPILLIHGKDDTVVLYEQSVIMRQALERAGKPVELVTLKGEDHWLSRGETRLQMLQSTVAFLEKHNPPN